MAFDGTRNNKSYILQANRSQVKNIHEKYEEFVRAISYIAKEQEWSEEKKNAFLNQPNWNTPKVTNIVNNLLQEVEKEKQNFYRNVEEYKKQNPKAIVFRLKRQNQEKTYCVNENENGYSELLDGTTLHVESFEKSPFSKAVLEQFLDEQEREREEKLKEQQKLEKKREKELKASMKMK